MASLPNDGSVFRRLHGRFPWGGHLYPGDATQRLSQRALKVASAFSYCSTRSAIVVPCSVSEDVTKSYRSGYNEYIRVRRQRMGIAGALASALPQGILISVDIMKSNMQASPNKYRNVQSTFRSLLATGGDRALTRGLVPTIIGYSIHGFVKFSMFDWFQQLYHTRFGLEQAEKREGMVRWVSMACAEFVAVIPLSPLAMVKLKLETSAPGSWPTRFVPAVKKMCTNRAKTGFPFRPIFMLWSRQIPLSVSQLYLFDWFRTKVSSHVGAEQRHRWELGIMMLCGFGVAIVSTPLSQPADYVLSRFSVAETQGKSAMRIIAEDGVRNALTRGFAPRYVMVGMMTAMQFCIFENVMRVVS